MNPIFRLVIRDIRATMDRSLISIQIAFPVLLLFVSGYAYGGIVAPLHVGGRTVAYPTFLAAGAIELSIMFGSLFAGALVWADRRLNMFQQILAGPFTRWQYVLGKVGSSMLVGVAGAAVVSVIAIPTLLGLTLSPFSFVYIAAAVLLSAFFMGSAAIVISTFVTSEQVFNALFNLLVFVLMFVSSIYYPAQTAPQVLRDLFLLNPLTYSVDLLRFGLLGMWTPSLPYEVGLLAAEGSAAFAAAVLRFRNVRV